MTVVWHLESDITDGDVLIAYELYFNTLLLVVPQLKWFDEKLVFERICELVSIKPPFQSHLPTQLSMHKFLLMRAWSLNFFCNLESKSSIFVCISVDLASTNAQTSFISAFALNSVFIYFKSCCNAMTTSVSTRPVKPIFAFYSLGRLAKQGCD